MFEPNFSFKLPPNGIYNSAKKFAEQNNLRCEVYEDLGELRVGFWDKVMI